MCKWPFNIYLGGRWSEQDICTCLHTKHLCHTTEPPWTSPDRTMSSELNKLVSSVTSLTSNRRNMFSASEGQKDLVTCGLNERTCSRVSGFGFLYQGHSENPNHLRPVVSRKRGMFRGPPSHRLTFRRKSDFESNLRCALELSEQTDDSLPSRHVCKVSVV